MLETPRSCLFFRSVCIWLLLGDRSYILQCTSTPSDTIVPNPLCDLTQRSKWLSSVSLVTVGSEPFPYPNAFYWSKVVVTKYDFPAAFLVGNVLALLTYYQSYKFNKLDQSMKDESHKQIYSYPGVKDTNSISCQIAIRANLKWWKRRLNWKV